MVILKNESQIIYVGHHGNRISWKLLASYDGEKYKLVFQKYDRTQPTKEDRLNGIKPRRILKKSRSFFFSELENINIDLLPCPVLGARLLEKINKSKDKSA